MSEAEEMAASNWHVLTKTENGTVSLIRNLPLATAVQIYQRLDPSRGRASGQMYAVNGGDIRDRELIGPGGWDGCTKGMKHDFPDNVGWNLVDRGPNEGRSSRSRLCTKCGFYLFEWQDETQPHPSQALA